MNEPLLLRAVDHPAARDAYRVVWRDIEVGSIGLQQGAGQRVFWHWGLDTVGNLGFPTRGDTISRDDAMAQFREAWDRFVADPARLQRMVEEKADSAERMKHWGPGR